jgi:integrase
LDLIRLEFALGEKKIGFTMAILAARPEPDKPKLLDQVRELLGHKDVNPTMIYMHVLNRPGLGVRSPLD